MAKITVEKSDEKDLIDTMEVVKSAVLYLKENNVDQWQDGFPAVSDIIDDYRHKETYKICVDGKEVGFFALDYSIDESYEKIDGKWQTNGKYAAIHRTAINRESRNKGLSKLIFDTALDRCRAENIKSLRIDTHKDNKVMIHLIEKNHFKYAGEITLLNGCGKRNAYERTVE